MNTLTLGCLATIKNKHAKVCPALQLMEYLFSYLYMKYSSPTEYFELLLQVCLVF